PFFLFLSYLNPHDIYHFSQRNERAKDKSDISLPESFSDNLSKKPFPQRQFMEEDQGKFINNTDNSLWEAYRQYYREKVKMVDTEIGIVLDALKKSGLAENTLIVFTSDHGDMDTAHRLVFKGPFMYEEMLRVPLIISYPGNLPTGEKRNQMVQNIDLLPTLAEAAGITVPHLIDGKSLMPVLQNKDAKGRDYIITEYYAKQEWITPIRSIRTKDWKYNLYKKWGEELYSLRDDSKEMNNLADNSVYKEKKQELHKRLQESMKAADDYFRYLRPTDRMGRVLDV
ncbi:sulfatase-like hydrolase/transferase, partial [bacterium]|nr:sulfatase-like hydrolase/transferase [bacterium]